MSEYWKSTPKYWCKHCSTYVKETPFERKQHESTAKHQNNLKRFLRNIQNNHERGEREKERAKSEVERLKDVAGGDTKRSSTPSHSPSKPTPPTVQKPTSGAQSIADRKRQWAQLSEMGIKVPEGFRSEMAIADGWQMVSQQVVDETRSESPLSTGVKKRKYEGQEEDEEEKIAAGEAVVRRGWGATTKSYPGHDNPDLDDLLLGPVSVKKEKTGSSTSQFKAEEKESLKQENNPALNQDGIAAGNYSSAEVEDSLEDNANKDGLVKEETDPTQAFKPMHKVPEEVSMPVFRKRKAKAS